MKKFICFLLICLVLAGCSKGNMTESTSSVTGNTEEEAKNPALPGETELESEEKYEPVSDEEQAGIIEFLERFEEDYIFSDMESSRALSYGEPIAEYYDFHGRMTEDGFGYVLAFRKSGTDPLADLSIYGLDGYTEAEIWDEEEGEYRVAYSFKNTGWIYQGEDDRILYLQPIDMEEPEELRMAFVYRYCSGDEGVQYLDDALERGIRFTPPDTEAYLAANRYENGKQYFEYAILTEEEEQKILDSDELIDSDLYGEYGLQFFVSQEAYENGAKEENDITTPALEIAKEKFRFEILEPKEIHDIVKAELSMKVWESQNGESGSEENGFGKDQEFFTVTELLTDDSQLKELEEILSASRVDMEGKCPYTGILTLTREDGAEIVVSLATDSCDSFILGSHGVYSPGREEMERIWELFPECREYTGWAMENKMP